MFDMADLNKRRKLADKWSLAFVVLGIIFVILAIAAPFILYQFTPKFNPNAPITTSISYTTTINCPGGCNYGGFPYVDQTFNTVKNILFLIGLALIIVGIILKIVAIIYWPKSKK
jgi:hypothetical protein